MTEEEKLRDRLTKLDALAARPGNANEGFAAKRRADDIRTRLAQLKRAKAGSDGTGAWASTQWEFDGSPYREPSQSAQWFHSEDASRSDVGPRHPRKARLSKSLGGVGAVKAAAAGLVMIAGFAWVWRAEHPNAPKGSLMLKDEILAMRAESKQASMSFKQDSFICFTRARARSHGARAKSLATVDDYLALYKECMEGRGWRGETVAK